MNTSIYFDEKQQMWAIDIEHTLYTFAFSKVAAEKILKKLHSDGLVI
jgi:hypothetical protein